MTDHIVDFSKVPEGWDLTLIIQANGKAKAYLEKPGGKNELGFPVILTTASGKADTPREAFEVAILKAKEMEGE